MDKVELLAAPQAEQPLAREDRVLAFAIQGIEGQQRVESERCVVEIALARPIGVAAPGSSRRSEKGHDQIGGIPQRAPGQTGHLQHVESLAHAPVCSLMRGRLTVGGRMPHALGFCFAAKTLKPQFVKNLAEHAPQ